MNKCGQDIEIEIRVLNEESKKYAENFGTSENFV